MTKRIAMWSGPRNISTTMMRSFENRPDCAVIDEPFYAHYLSVTDLNHPMRDEVLAAQSAEWQTVKENLTTATPAPIWFQKHMTQHMTEEIKTDWLGDLDHFFLIRDPVRMVASYAEKSYDLASVSHALRREAELFEEITGLTGKIPPVVNAKDVLTNPHGILTALCAALKIPFNDAMLSWPAGTRKSDGVWASHWYKSVETSTRFRLQSEKKITLSEEQAIIADACKPHYEKLFTKG